jgi:hypothetical protein
MRSLNQAKAWGQSTAQAAIDAGFNPRVLQAASGICGPTQPVYDVYTIGSATAGIWQLPDLNMTRGRVNLPVPVTYDDLRETVGIASNYDSSDGDGTHGDVVKPCYTVTCAGTGEFEVEAEQTCLKFSNFQGMFNPEWVAHLGTQSLMTHAHRVNRRLLTDAQNATQTVDYATTDGGGGALVQVGRQAIHAAFLYRDKYRLDQMETLEVVLPYMVLGALQADGLARGDGLSQSFAIAAAISAIQRENNIRFQFVYDYIDGVEAPGDFGDQAYRALVYPAGAILHIGGQTLNFGEVRDSTYNSRNEYGSWTETFDGLAFAATEVMQITGLVACPNGATGQTEAITCTSGASAS